jgi:hypothetical protein
MGPEFHKFLIQGTDQIYLIHLPMFHVANHRQQLVASATFNDVAKEKYLALRKSNTTEPMFLVTSYKTFLADIIESRGSFKGQIRTNES